MAAGVGGLSAVIEGAANAAVGPCGGVAGQRGCQRGPGGIIGRTLNRVGGRSGCVVLPGERD